MEDDKRDEAIGYGRPPRETQFRKGKSGNPGGRPRKDRGQSAIAARVLGEVQRLNGQPKGSRVRYTTIEIVIMRLKQLAAAGPVAAGKLFNRYMERYKQPAPPQGGVGYLVVPEVLTEEEWVAKYSPKDNPPDEADEVM